MAQTQLCYVAGLGCRRHCTEQTLLELLIHSLAAQQLPLSALSALATAEHKQHEPGLLQLAAHLNLPLYALPAAQLARYESRLTQQSALSQQTSGSSGVAQASAIALAEQLSGQSAKLLGPRHNNAQATCALAVAVLQEQL